MTITPDRLKSLDSITLAEGNHATRDQGMCAMEVVAWLAGEGHTDAPACASPVLRTYTISLNDRWDTPTRQRLVPYLPRMVGTNGDGLDEARSYMALDWLIRTHTPAWLDLAGLTEEAAELRGLRRIVDLVAAQQAGPVVKSARTKAAAAWDAAKVAAGDAAWDAARAAAWYAARAAAWDAARVAAGVAAWDAAGVAAWDAARAAAWAAARAAAWAAARDAAWDAARAAAWDAARAAAGVAAWDAAGAAAWDAARVAAGDALRPRVETLQTSSLDLLDRMIVGKWDA